MSLEDEAGLANRIIMVDVCEKNRATVIRSKFILADGVLQIQDDVIHVTVAWLRRLPIRRWRCNHMTSTKSEGHFGGYRREVEVQKLSPALVIASSLVFAIRTAWCHRRTVTASQIWNGK